MSHRETEHLRVTSARIAWPSSAPIVAALGHEAIAREMEVEDVGAVGEADEVLCHALCSLDSRPSTR